MKINDRLAQPVLALHNLQICFSLGFVQAGRGLNIEACTGDQIARQDLLGQMVDQNLFIEPGFSFRNGPFPKLRMQVYGAGDLFERAAKGWKKGIGFRYDIEVKFFVLEIPVGSGRPGGCLIVPMAVDAGKIIIAQPFDARREIFRCFDRKLRLCGGFTNGGSSEFVSRLL